MNRNEILARMEALVREGEGLLEKVSQRDRAAIERHAEVMDEFDMLNRSLTAREGLDERDAPEGDVQFETLTRDANMAHYIRAIMGGEGARLEGAAAELNTELGAASQRGGVVVPWGVLERAATTTQQLDAAPNQTIIGRVFAPSLADWFGARMRQVPVGTTELAVVTGKGSVVEQVAEGSGPSADPSAATFDTVTLKPKRLTGEAEITAEAIAQVSGLERAIATDTLAEINDTVSDALLNGDGSATKVHGFLSRIAEPGNPAAQVTLADFMAMPVEAVDGIYADTEQSVALLFGLETYKRAGALFATNQDTTNALAYLRANSAGVRASAKVANGGGSGNAGDKAKRQAVVARRGMRADASYAAVWNAGPELVRDPYSKADAGTLRLVWHLLWDARVAVRPAEWSRLLIQHAA